ncbi:hypothetical protein [Aeromicrobium fastidiosum]|uniref:Uncharacterized protein n=1 Tax=Aeromicrobium fastidiosum TaxID=52699 RepID=A0A641ATI5_9ACTN|nr:hypothetical protein [Aeromicrobium fastidiosum]KAA1380361.1 hypothetical protein ESP62_004025 [Aeromicrobium fastidiosum]MBP2389929.1 hypothetical protein [Aeromicrobium fastidiosum]
MTFDIPTPTALLVVLAVAAILSAAVLLSVFANFLLENRKVRVARHQPVTAYYGNLILGR